MKLKTLKSKRKENDDSPQITDTERARMELRAEGLVDLVEDAEDIDKEYLHLPSNLSDLTQRDIGKHLNAIMQQMIWVRTLAARMDSLIAEVKFELDKIRAVVYPTLPVKMSITERELVILANPKARPLVEKMQYLQQKRNLIEVNWESLNDAKFSVSREISLRVGEQKDQGRLENVNGMKRGEFRRGNI